MSLEEWFGASKQTAEQQVEDLPVYMVVDLSNILFRTIYSDSSIKRAEDVSIDLLRHVALNSIMDYLKKVRAKFPDRKVTTVLAHDAGSWRNEIFDYYKWSRKQKDPDASEQEVAFKSRCYECFDQLTSEASAHYPFISVKVPRCEADDICAWFAAEYGQFTDVVLVSADKDIKQLAIGRVHSLAPVHGSAEKKWFQFKTVEQQSAYVLDLVLRGDGGDGIPNVLSAEDTFAVKEKRQKPMTEKQLGILHAAVTPGDHLFTGIIKTQAGARFALNMELIDLRGCRNLPPVLSPKIAEAVNDSLTTLQSRKESLYRYFAQNGMNRHLQNIELFIK
jgi:endogenous inhibitor of DNA gyrase (YacG/DUF329 family)